MQTTTVAKWHYPNGTDEDRITVKNFFDKAEKS